MASSLMIRTQQRVAPGTALRVAASCQPRRLEVTEGRLWLTGEGIEGDLWLRCGESHTIAPDAELVAEGWPSARFELVAQAPARRVSLWRAVGARRSQPACA